MTMTILLWLSAFAAQLTTAEHWDVGLAAGGGRIEAVAVPGSSAASPTVLIVGGLRGNDETVRLVRSEVTAFQSLTPARRRFRLIAIPLANPDGSVLTFPPA